MDGEQNVSNMATSLVLGSVVTLIALRLSNVFDALTNNVNAHIEGSRSTPTHPLLVSAIDLALTFSTILVLALVGRMPGMALKLGLGVVVIGIVSWAARGIREKR